MKLLIEIPDKVKMVFDKAENNVLKGSYYDHGGIIGAAIKNGIPFEQIKAEKAYWIPIPYMLEYETDAKCSLCGALIVDGIGYDYCPKCGVRMIREVQK